MRTIFLLCGTLFLITVFSGCDPNNSTNTDNEQGRFSIIATTGQIHDALRAITEGTDCSIHLFCGPGVDPHSFSATAQDVQRMIDADLIIYNGFHLEAKLSDALHDTFKAKAWSMASAFPNDARIDWVEDGQVDPEAPFDPHIWNHLPAWSKCVEKLAKRLAEEDPDNADGYVTNARAYVEEIMKAHAAAKEKLQQIPAERRFLVSAHDAFNYFAKQYGMETKAVLGIGNDPEADIRTMQDVAKTICEKKIPAIFMESITNPKITAALQEACAAQEWKVEIVDTPLYSDDLGENEPQNTFLGAFNSNVDVIYEALK